MRFQNPEFLLLLLLLPLLFLATKSHRTAIRYSSLDALRSAHRSLRLHPRLILLSLRTLALTSLILALARPQEGKKFSEILTEGVDIVMALDTSGSMAAEDFQINSRRVNRLEVVRNVVSDFVKKRSNDRIGLVVFGEEAFTQCPLTLDHGIVLDFLQNLEIAMAGNATAVGSAIGVAVNRMKDLKAKSRIIILLTDGRSNAGDLAPVKAAELAQSLGIKVYTIGVGTRGEAPYPVEGPFGKSYQMIPADLDEETLESIAKLTAAKYYRATDSEELQKIYDEIDQLEKTEVKLKEYSEYYERFSIFLMIGLGLLGLELILSQTRLRILP